MKKHVMHVLNSTGHQTVVKWAPTDKLEIKTAEEVFGNLQAKKFHMFDITDPQNGKKLTAFDPDAKEIIAFGQPQGG